MNGKNPNHRIIFGLKVKQLRMEKNLSFAELSKQSGLSVSYLNEIEKGKKYPKEDKIRTLAAALGISIASLTSVELTKSLAPVGELLKSNFLNELPLDLFGIELSKVVEIIANAPIRVGAFISTLVELARNYALGEENFYHGAMRAYQELHYNYFEEIEQAAQAFVQTHQLPTAQGIALETLAKILRQDFNYTIDENGLDGYPDLQDLRSVFVARNRKLILNSALSPIQRAFQYGKEIGFNQLNLKDRSTTSSLLRVRSFDEVLNHFKASYFSVAILINRETFIEELKYFFALPTWDGEAFLALMKKYNASPEMLFQRLTNLIPRYFGLRKLFFLRVIHNPTSNEFQIDKELHLNRQHHPHSNGLFEHYCRRWLSLSLLKDLHEIQKGGKYVGTIVGAQRSKYFGTEDEYLCLTLARPASPTPNRNISVTIGILIDDELRKTIQFLDDPSISFREVNTTCQRCAIENCQERATSATIIEKRRQRRSFQEALRKVQES